MLLLVFVLTLYFSHLPSESISEAHRFRPQHVQSLTLWTGIWWEENVVLILPKMRSVQIFRPKIVTESFLKNLSLFLTHAKAIDSGSMQIQSATGWYWPRIYHSRRLLLYGIPGSISAAASKGRLRLWTVTRISRLHCSECCTKLCLLLRFLFTTSLMPVMCWDACS